MKTLPKIFLTGSAVLFAISLTEPGSQVHFGLLMPVSALMFIAFFITHLGSGFDPGQYAEDNRLREQLLKAPVPSDEPGRLERLAA